MKKILLILSLFQVALFSCNQEIDFPYEGKDRIHFEHYTTSESGRIYYNTKVVSLGLLNDTIEYDTARVVLNLLGKVTDVDRSYKVKINADSTNAETNVHYLEFNKTQTFRAGRTTDTLKIVIVRKNLSASFRNPQDKFLYLEIESSNDFDLGLKGGLSMKLKLNNYLSEPQWWLSKFWGGLYYYHPAKWKVLIGFNNVFANFVDVPFDYNSVGGKQYMRDLEYYLDQKVPTYDDETGERVKFKSLEPVI